MTRTPYESAAAPTSRNAADPAELNVVCRLRPKQLSMAANMVALSSSRSSYGNFALFLNVFP